MLRLIVSLVLHVPIDTDSQIRVLIVRMILLLMCAFYVLSFMCIACMKYELIIK